MRIFRHAYSVPRSTKNCFFGYQDSDPFSGQVRPVAGLAVTDTPIVFLFGYLTLSLSSSEPDFNFTALNLLLPKFRVYVNRINRL